MSFNTIKTNIKGLIHLEPKLYGDSRGYFLETYNLRDMKECGIDETFVQDNESRSKKGVLRGLHFQKKQTQGKLVRCVFGKVLDVAVDLRKDSPFYGRWESVILDSDRKNILYIPRGFAHGFLVLTEEAVFSYKCTDYYAPEFDGGIRWDDPDIGIDWKLGEFGISAPELSEKDRSLPFMRDIELDF